MNRGGICCRLRSGATLAAFCVLSPAPVANAPEERMLPVQVSHVESPGALAELVDTVIRRASAERLDSLTASSDPTIALAAGWERVLRKTPAKTKDEFAGPYTTAVARFNAIPGPQKADLSRFLKLVEKRTRLPIPRAWQASMSHAKYDNEGDIWFATIDDPPPAREAMAGFRWEQVNPRREGNNWIVRRGHVSLAIPASHDNNAYDWATLKVNDGTVYVALYTSSPDPYTICALERSTGRIIWSSQAWAGGGYLLGLGTWARSGIQMHHVGIQATERKLGVFGISDCTAYVEVFDARTGKNECRFSTSYFPTVRTPTEPGVSPKAEQRGE